MRRHIGHKTAPPEWSRKIETLRRRLSHSQGTLGHELNTSPMTVSRLERGSQEPPADMYIQLGNLAGDPECWYFWERAGSAQRGSYACPSRSQDTPEYDSTFPQVTDHPRWSEPTVDQGAATRRCSLIASSCRDSRCRRRSCTKIRSSCPSFDARCAQRMCARIQRSLVACASKAIRWLHRFRDY